jgi:hypothetical protein
MAALCPQCGRPNPAEARYCYLDGASLVERADGPVDFASIPFRAPSTFPSGAVCRNLDQLALACQNHWGEAAGLLGSVEQFLAEHGRADLACVARTAAAQADPQRGLDYLLSRLPNHNLGPPSLDVEPRALDLGILPPGTEASFVLRLSNKGHRLLTGSISSDCAWLQPEGTIAGQPRLFEFPHELTLRIILPGPALAAAPKAQRGQIFVESNGGALAIPVTYEAPAVPFPSGVLQGCRTPRQLAHEAKHHPKEAAELFYSGAVAAWYRANGWIYPVEGAPASGVAAVQQFFEALGLTKPPQVVLDTPRLAFQGAPGARLRQIVYFHTEENRRVYIFGRAREAWLSVLEASCHGSRATLLVEVAIPDVPGQVLETSLDITANGNQRLYVPVAVHVELSAPFASPYRAAAVGRGRGRFFAAAVMLLGLLLLGVPAFVLLRQHFVAAPASPLAVYAAAIDPDTFLALHIDFRSLRNTPGFADDFAALAQALALPLRDLGVSGGAANLQALFRAYSAGEPPLEVWSCAAPVKIGAVVPGRYETETYKTTTLYVDALGSSRAWAVDAKGRLLHGTVRAFQGALSRAKARQPPAAYETLARAAVDVPTGAPAWVVADLHAPGVREWFASIGAAVAQPERFYAALLQREGQLVVAARGQFATKEEGIACRERLRALPELPLSALPEAFSLHALVQGARWEHRGADVRAEVPLQAAPLQIVLRTTATNLQEAETQARLQVEKLLEDLLARGSAAMKDGDYAWAEEKLRKAHALFPTSAAAAEQWAAAKSKLQEKRAFERDVRAAQEALAAGELARVSAYIVQLRKSPFTATEVPALEKELQAKEQAVLFEQAHQEAQQALNRGDLDKARQLYERAVKNRPGDRATLRAEAAIARILEIQGCLSRGEKELAAERFKEAGLELRKSLDLLLQDPADPTWRDESFKYLRGRLMQRTASSYQNLRRAYEVRAEQARASADLSGAKMEYTRSAAEYEDALKYLQDAKAVAEDVRRGDAAIVGDQGAVLRDLGAELAEMRRGAYKARALNHLALARQGYLQGKEAFARARQDPATIPAALAQLDAALGSLQKAEKLGEVTVEPLRRDTEALRGRFERLNRLFEVDFQGAPLPSDWKNEHWELKSAAEANAWLQAGRFKIASLQSEVAPWPYDFELEILFALVSPDGKINNQFWENFVDPLSFTLLADAERGDNIVLRLGKDTTVKFQNAVRLAVGKETNALHDVLASHEPIKLVVQCKNEELHVFINGRKIRSIAARHGFSQLRIDAAPPFHAALGRFVAFPALYRIALKPLAKDDEK